MSARELTRVEVLSRVKAGTLSLGSAATMLAVSYRQAKRLVRRYRTEGAKPRMPSWRRRISLSTTIASRTPSRAALDRAFQLEEAPPPKSTAPAAAAASRPVCRQNVDHPWRRGYAERQARAIELGRGQ